MPRGFSTCFASDWRAIRCDRCGLASDVGNSATDTIVDAPVMEGASMSRNFAFVFALVLALSPGTLMVSAPAFAQLTPPAGSAGAGNAPISGVPYGPANPRALSDPSGIGNAASVPPLVPNPPPPVSGSVNSVQLPQT